MNVLNLGLNSAWTNHYLVKTGLNFPKLRSLKIPATGKILTVPNHPTEHHFSHFSTIPLNRMTALSFEPFIQSFVRGCWEPCYSSPRARGGVHPQQVHMGEKQDGRKRLQPGVEPATFTLRDHLCKHCSAVALYSSTLKAVEIKTIFSTTGVKRDLFSCCKVGHFDTWIYGD